jgi:class 3 adenylate cyclase
MALKDEITTEVKKIFAAKWETRDGTKVPEAEEVQMGNEAVEIDGTILYADLNGSTAMVDAYEKSFAAEIYKTYLFSAAKVIRAEGGVIVSYDGDRVMAVFMGGQKNTSAVRCALKINWAVKNIVMPLKSAQYPDNKFIVRHVVGIDTCKLWVARTGVRGANDLVWIGSAANYAAKLTELDSTYPTWITHRVYDMMLDEAKFSNGKAIYRSNYSWVIN